MTTNATAVPVRALARAWEALARQQTSARGQACPPGLRMFLECDSSFEQWIRSEMDDFVTFVDERRDADVRVRVTAVAAHGKIRHYQVDFVGTGPLELIEASARFHVSNAPAARVARPNPIDADASRRQSAWTQREHAPVLVM